MGCGGVRKGNKGLTMGCVFGFFVFSLEIEMGNLASEYIP